MGKRYQFSLDPLTIGATDCKNNLLGVLDALEFLLENNFEPKRTILAGFGFDEEIRYNSTSIDSDLPIAGPKARLTSLRFSWIDMERTVSSSLLMKVEAK